ncbi:MAG: preprotein translocase subunit SecG [Candidatus Moranbacteria bacterium]|nr:preprotein translocase subunit SecG [Candidatus Moranbacteria bacterium]
MIFTNILPYLQIILSIILIVAILLQQSSAGVGGAFGGGESGLYNTRRGFEKFLFIFTIVIAILFAASAFVAIFVK